MASKPNVLLLIGSFDMGGAEGQIVLLARMLQEHGRYRPHLACLNARGVLRAEAERIGVGEIPEYRLTSFYDGNMLKQLRRFARLLREREIDVVHTEGFYTNVFGMAGATLARVPARIAFRGETGGWRTPAQNRVERFAFHLAHVVHANSEAVRRQLIENGVASKKIATVYNGLDLARVAPPVGIERAAALDAFNLPSQPTRRCVTIIANLRHEVKDHPMFLRAARRVREAVPDAAFVIAGEGELMTPMRSLAAQLGLEQDVFFTGRCDDVAKLLFVSDICVLSSKAEGFSNSILEYMAAARPVVATDVGGAREVIAEGESGYLVASGDDEAMAARIISLLRDPAGARQMGERGRSIIERNFSAAAQLENTQRLYDRCLAATAPARLQTVKGVSREGAS